MNNYFEVVKMAILFFPFIALLMTFPFILVQYHKYGSISFYKTIIIYLFTLYLTCAYFLVILPLPKISEVAALTTPRMQLIPFSFIFDFIKNTSLDITNIHTYIGALKESYFFVPIYNILLTIPFGIFLRYYFKCDIKKVIIFSFLLSLFFELTQLSGLYFIYPRGYRLFDVDDLILNTIGGILGYMIAEPLINVLPTIEKVNFVAKEKGKTISGFRKTSTALLDFILFLIIYLLLEKLLNQNIKSIYILITSILFYYYIIPMFLNCSTIAQNFLNIKVLDYNNEPNIFRFFLRNITIIIIYIILPYLIFNTITKLNINEMIKEFTALIFILITFLMYVITIIKYVFTNKTMFYEKISKTKLTSTIK